MTPLDEAAQQHVITARAAAGMCDPGEMAATMDEAREALQAMNDEPRCTCGAGYLTIPRNHAEDCPIHHPQADFSAANDAALSAAADQYEDWLDWRWTCGIG